MHSDLYANLNEKIYKKKSLENDKYIDRANIARKEIFYELSV
jgi:hypothetical protein